MELPPGLPSPRLSPEISKIQELHLQGSLGNKISPFQEYLHMHAHSHLSHECMCPGGIIVDIWNSEEGSRLQGSPIQEPKPPRELRRLWA